MDIMRPRIIHADGSIIDASNVCSISPIEELHTGEFTFEIVGDSDYVRVSINLSDKHKLAEIRRRLIGFIWPNADVFDMSKANTTS